MASTVVYPPTIISRLERLDIMMGYLEELRGSKGIRRSSRASTTSSGTATSDGDVGNSSAESSPRRRTFERRRRPIGAVVEEVQSKGSLMERLDLVEVRILKLVEEMEEEKRKSEEEERSPSRRHRSKGLKGLVKSCIKGKEHKTKE